MTVRNATEFCQYVSNRLGYLPPGYGEKPDWEIWRLEASKLKRAIASREKEPGNRDMFTWANLELAVEYLWRQRRGVKTAAGVLYYVKPALDAANAVENKSVLTVNVEQALAWEMAQEPADDDWISRLTRSHGSARQDLLAEWLAAGRGDRSG